jgi:hypothetical protein
MPVFDNVGYGESTPVKYKHLKAIFAMHTAITRAVINRPQNSFRRTYRYIELTAGKGFTPVTGERGSPLLFLEQMHAGRCDLTYQADFIENNPANCEELKRNVLSEASRNHWGRTSTNYHSTDYEKAVPQLLKSKDSRELGMVFADPSGNLPDFPTLKYINEVRPRMEILIYISTTNVKRVYNSTSKKLDEHMASIGKNHWLIRAPVSWDKFKWTFLLGTNTGTFKDYKKIGLYRLESEPAQEIFHKLNLTKEERDSKSQPRLFY